MNFKIILENALEENKKYRMYSREVNHDLGTLPDCSMRLSKKNILNKLKDFEIKKIEVYSNEIFLNDYKEVKGICIREINLE